MRKADSLPPLHSDGDDQEDADREREVAAALKEGEDEIDEGVSGSKVIRKHKKIRKKEENIRNAETGEKLVEQVGHGSEKKDVSEEIMSDCFEPVTEHQKADNVSKQC